MAVSKFWIDCKVDHSTILSILNRSSIKIKTWQINGFDKLDFKISQTKQIEFIFAVMNFEWLNVWFISNVS